MFGGLAPVHRLVPYCGRPALPGELWRRWNLDPVLITLLLAMLGAYLLATRRSASASRSRLPLRRILFITGWLVATVALISPLCALSVSLFSARVGQHMILTLVAAPLVVLAHPEAALAECWPSAAAWSRRNRVAKACTSAAGATGLFAALVWFWHAPGPYAATFASWFVYWLMHLSLFGSALLFWAVLLSPDPPSYLPALAAGAFGMLQMTFLGALITITPHALYSVHEATTLAWGLTPLADQQLGGLVMWVPAYSILLGVTVLTLARAMTRASQALPFHSAWGR